MASYDRCCFSTDMGPLPPLTPVSAHLPSDGALMGDLLPSDRCFYPSALRQRADGEPPPPLTAVSAHLPSDGGEPEEPERSPFSARSSASCPRLLSECPLSVSPAAADGPASGAILPIFHKLVSERQRSRPAPVLSAASCPNITVKCDIVQYL